MVNELPENTNVGESQEEYLKGKTITKPTKEDLPKEKSTGDIGGYREELRIIKENAEEAVKKSKDTQSLVFLGFFVLLLMVIGLVFGYIQFLVNGNKEVNQRDQKNIYEMINSENKLKDSSRITDCANISTVYSQFKNCLDK
jgi:hypothetical protein